MLWEMRNIYIQSIKLTLLLIEVFPENVKYLAIPLCWDHYGYQPMRGGVITPSIPRMNYGFVTIGIIACVFLDWYLYIKTAYLLHRLPDRLMYWYVCNSVRTLFPQQCFCGKYRQLKVLVVNIVTHINNICWTPLYIQTYFSDPKVGCYFIIQNTAVPYTVATLHAKAFASFIWAVHVYAAMCWDRPFHIIPLSRCDHTV